MNKVIICGGNGVGKSTLGNALAEKTGWVFRDIEDYYFPKTCAEYAYAVSRTEEEVVKLLYEDLKKYDNLILAAVRGNYSKEIETMFTYAIFISVPKAIRMKRVWERSYKKFGDRMLEGGDLYEKEKSFFDMIEKRSDKTVTDWLDTMNIPIITVDGTRATEDSVAEIISKLSDIATLNNGASPLLK